MNEWPIRIAAGNQHPSQDRDLSYWFHRLFHKWIYAHSTQIRIMQGEDGPSNYWELYDWVSSTGPDHARQVWLVLDRMGIDDQRNPVFLQGQIRFRSRELHMAFLLRFPVDTDQGYAII